MEIETNIRMVGRVFHSEINIVKFSAAEQEALAAQGPRVVDLGGTFEYGEGQDFTLPTNEVYFPTDLPYKEIFDMADHDEEAELFAAVWRDEIKTRVVAAKDAIITAQQQISLVGRNIDTV